MYPIGRLLRTRLALAAVLFGLLLLPRASLVKAASLSSSSALSSRAPAAVTDCSTQPQIPQAECEALVALYDSTNGPNWTDSPGNGWNRTQAPCQWADVNCDKGHVNVVTRYKRNLVGILPDLSDLVMLAWLDLNQNHLSGTIPTSLPAYLGYLNLTGNELTGSIPDLTAFTNLRTLELSDNQLSGFIPTPLPATLSTLRLGYNHLTGAIPISLPANLGTLDLPDNHLGGSIPANLPTLLRNLDLAQNQLSGSIPATLPMHLNILKLQNNQLSGVIPGRVCLVFRPPDLGYNKFTGEEEPCVTQADFNWAATQTVPPTGVSAQPFSDTGLQLGWTPIQYTGDGGYYEVLCRTTNSDPYVSRGKTADKTASGLTLTGLTPATAYQCVVRTFTPAHGLQQNDLTSLDSVEASATTDSTPSRSHTWLGRLLRH